MPISEARHRANEKYNAKAYEEIKVRVQKGKKEIIQEEAKKAGMSTNAYINEAIDAMMRAGGYGIETTENTDKPISRSVSHVGLSTENEKKNNRLTERR